MEMHSICIDCGITTCEIEPKESDEESFDVVEDTALGGEGSEDNPIEEVNEEE